MAQELQCDCPGHVTLSMTELEPGLWGRQCSVCGALVLELEDYRRWLSGRDPGPAPEPDQIFGAPVAQDGDAPRARLCPVCSRPMARYRVGSQPDFHLDRCAPCQLLRLDKGEWPALKALGLHAHLELVLSDGWQRNLQAVAATERRRLALRQRLGNDCFDELLRIQSWLQTHPRQRELLALLNGDPL